MPPGTNPWLKATLALLFSGSVAARRASRLGRSRAGQKLFLDFPGQLVMGSSLHLHGRCVFLNCLSQTNDTSPGESMSWPPARHVILTAEARDGQGRLLARVPGITSDNSGFIDQTIALPASTGSVRLQGDHHIVNPDLELKFLDLERPLEVVISDVDKTFLDSRLRNVGELIGMMRTEGSARRFVPGMPELARTWVDCGEAQRIWTFLTGGPFFFQRNILQAMSRVDVPVHTMFLRGLPLAAVHKSQWNPLYMLEIMNALASQAGYKTLALLNFLLKLPAGAGVSLLGDDSESDHFAYAGIAHLLSGNWSPENLASRVLSRSGTEWSNPVLKLARELTGKSPELPKIKLIAVRRTGKKGSKLDQDLELMPEQLTLIHQTTEELADRML